MKEQRTKGKKRGKKGSMRAKKANQNWSRRGKRKDFRHLAKKKLERKRCVRFVTKCFQPPLFSSTWTSATPSTRQHRATHLTVTNVTKCWTASEPWISTSRVSTRTSHTHVPFVTDVWETLTALRSTFLNFTLEGQTWQTNIAFRVQFVSGISHGLGA